MNNRAYNKAKEHLRDFTKFPTINDIVLLMEEHAKNVSIEFAHYLLSKTITKSRGIDENKTYHPWEFNLLRGELLVGKDEVYEQFLKEQENENL